jgi:hypothetical protein
VVKTTHTRETNDFGARRRPSPIASVALSEKIGIVHRLVFQCFVAISSLLPLACAHPAVNTQCAQFMPEEVGGMIVSADTVNSMIELSPGTNGQRYKVLRDLFRRAGCLPPMLTDQPAGRASLPNISCIIPGRSTRTIVVGAHFDKVPQGDGVADNWSGAVLLPILYRSLAMVDLEHTFHLVAFSAEEVGMIGSTHFVQSLSQEAQESIRAMVNIDTLGLGPLMAGITSSDPELLCNFWLASSMTGAPTRAVKITRGLAGDFDPFVKAGIPTIDFSSISGNIVGVLHTKNDSIQAIDRDEYYSSYNLLAAFLLIADQTLKASDEVRASESGI